MTTQKFSTEQIKEYIVSGGFRSDRLKITPDSIINRELPDIFFETLKRAKCGIAANGTLYRNDKHGFMGELMKMLYDKRKETKKEMLAKQQVYANTKDESLVSVITSLDAKQMAWKILLNSAYGAMASPYFRFFNNDLAEGITLSGQTAIRTVGEDINKFLNKANGTAGVDYVIYSDTDSVYVSFEKIVAKFCPDKPTEDKIQYLLKFSNNVMQKVIDKSCDSFVEYVNAHEQKLSMKTEAICDAGIWVAKKRYALNVHNNEGVQYAEPKIKVTGLEIVRSSTPHVVRDSLRDGVRQVLYGSEKTVRKFIADYRAKYDQEPVENISFPRGVNGLKTYAGSPIYAKGCPIHVRAALLYNHYIKKMGLEGSYELIGEGSKMKFVYLRLPNPFKENVMGYAGKLPPEFDLHKYVDYDTMFNKSFEEGMKSLIEPLGWSIEDRASLEDFFG